MQSKDLVVTILWSLATQIGVLSGLVDIMSWMDQVLDTFAGLSSDVSQQIFDCLNMLARTDFDIQPSEAPADSVDVT